MTEKRIKGNKGEDLVCEYLRKKGYIISAKNYTTRLGEIDIIAENRETVCFVEVKTRKYSAFSTPREAVDVRKQIRISRAAGEYIRKTKSPFNIRFDVAEVIYFGNESEEEKINYIENAFVPEEGFWI